MVLVWFDGGKEGQCHFLQQSGILIAKKEVDCFLGAAGCLPKLSWKVGNRRSVLGLPLLTNDMSEPGTGSYLESPPLLVNGDLFQ